VRKGVSDGDGRFCVPSSGSDEAGGPGRGRIEALRTAIRRLEHVPTSFGHPPAPEASLARPVCFSIPAHADPDAGTGRAEPPLHRLAQAGLHELKPASHADTPASVHFALCLLGLKARQADDQAAPLLWCLTETALHEWGAPYGPGLIALGLDPARILIVKARTVQDAAWVLEEGLKSGALTGLLGQAAIGKPVMARRLGLAAKQGGVPCLLLTQAGHAALPGALTRWRIETLPGRPQPFDEESPGPPAWRLTLERCRGAPPGRQWNVELRDEAYGVRLSAPLADRTADAGTGETRKAAK
jgi:protein ImuA